MKQLLILSGKGGTGKTTIASALIKLAKAKMYADCDVDAPNLHLLMNKNTNPLCSEYYGMPKAVIDSGLCLRCDVCRQNCRFEAISLKENYLVDTYSCEGCGVCEALCPVSAISLKLNVAGELMLYKDESIFSTACLKMGSGNSGKLVSEVKKQLLLNKVDTDIVIVDGSPGIGCPVIASLSGANMVLIVAEPSLSGINDMERIIKTAKQFDSKVAVCINKYDTNIANSNKIEAFCEDSSIPFLGKIPFDNKAVIAINHNLSVVDVDCAAGRAIKSLFEKALEILP